MSNWNKVRTKRTPVRDMARERACRQQPGPCIVRGATPEERARYGITAQPPTLAPALVPTSTQPICIEREPRTHTHITKSFLESEIRRGKDLKHIEREHGLRVGTLAPRMRKWGLKAKDLKKESPVRLAEREREKMQMLKELATGKSLAQIERENGMTPNTLGTKLRKWGIDRKEVQRR